MGIPQGYRTRWRPSLSEIRPLSILAMACLTGCLGREPVPQAWSRADGRQVSSQQLELDTVACRGEVEKAAVQGQAYSTIDSRLGADRQDMRVYKGCMASRGYLAAN